MMSSSPGAQRRTLRFILLGDSGVGKTSLIIRLINDSFNDKRYSTIGSEMTSKEMEVDGRQYTLDLVDTAGQERFKSICRNIYRGSNFCLLTFAVNNYDSFHNLQEWKEEFVHFYQEGSIKHNSGLPFIVIGNKIDTDSSRVVDRSSVLEWCGAHGNIPYFETSAKTGLNVREVFTAAVRRLHDFESINPTTSLEWQGGPRRSKGMADLNMSIEGNGNGSNGRTACCT